MEIRKKSRPLSRAEGFRIIAEYFSSGMSCIKYYSSLGMSECQFYRWKHLYMLEHPELRKQDKNPVVVKPKLFSPIEIKDHPAFVPASLPAIEIEYPGGICVRIAAGLNDVSAIERLIIH